MLECILSIRTGFLQIRNFLCDPYHHRTDVSKKDASDGSMTPFQAVCTALAATVGTGNIAGSSGCHCDRGGRAAIF
ncbi:MAG: alanine:cation symporter family protein [Blautia sp.]